MKLDILACVKQVPGTDRVRVDPATGSLVRSGGEAVMNPDDLHALEMGLSLRERHGGRLTVITLGPPAAEEALREAFCLGADRCVLVTDPRFAGSDAWVTAKILGRAVRVLGRFDVVLTGTESVDGNTSIVPFQLSEALDIPLLSQLHRIDIEGATVLAERLYGHEYQRISVALPVLIAVNREANTVRFPALGDIKTAYEMPLERLTMDDIGGEESDYGLRGSPTVVVDSEVFKHRRKREVIEGTTAEKAGKLADILKKHDIIRF